MNTILQTAAITSMNLRNLRSRLGTSLVIVVGIAGVVAVLVSVLAMSVGFRATMSNAGRADRAIVLRAGAASETSSMMNRGDIDAIIDAPGIKRGAGGEPIYSAEVVTLMQLPRKDGQDGSVALRGVSANPTVLRPELTIVEGRLHRDTVNEVIVGRNAQRLYRNLDVGDEIKARNTVWKVVGIFETGGDVHESELIVNNAMLQDAISWPGLFRGVLVMLESPDAFDTFKNALTSNPALSVDVVNERAYFQEQSEGVSSILQVVATFVAGIMAIGAVFGALNAMYVAIDKRGLEMATLRALGFGNVPIVVSVLAEAMLLALIGGAAGALLSWLAFSGYSVSTSAVGAVGAPMTRSFNLVVNAELITSGIVWACMIGFIGGVLPAIRTTRLPIAQALRRV